jgi:hypothetical protein
MKWLDEFSHSVYRNRDHRVIGLNELNEVSLCKAHSSTLYRAKKRHQRNMNQQQAPPSPADSNGTLMEDINRHRSSSVDSYPLLPQPYNNNQQVGGGALAAKVREISFQQYNNAHESPDFSMMASSTSVKRKRTNEKPSSSASTPLFYSNQHPYTTTTTTTILHSNNTRQPTNSFSSQLPPLHLRTPSLSSLSSTLQHQLHVSPNFTRPPPPPIYTKVIETVSLKGAISSSDEVYYIRNLAITDSYTFRDLLSEIDFAGSPPPGKRVVISDLNRERIFPLGQAIRSVIRYPQDTHIEFYLELSNKASIDWNNYK